MSGAETELEKTQRLLNFLLGETDDCVMKDDHRPNLSLDQAWTVIWWLGNEYWQVPAHIEKCDICGDLYDAHESGHGLDFGAAPYFFCEDCLDSDPYKAKSKMIPALREYLNGYLNGGTE